MNKSTLDTLFNYIIDIDLLSITHQYTLSISIDRFMSTMSPEYTLFFGTFIHLPRTPLNGKHILSIHRGALWVSSSDGRIKGIDWNVQDEASLRALIQRNGWVDGEVNGVHCGSSVPPKKVKIVRAREEHNEFFFPGFIGTSPHPM